MKGPSSSPDLPQRVPSPKGSSSKRGLRSSLVAGGHRRPGLPHGPRSRIRVSEERSMPRKLLFLFAIALCVPAALVGQTEVERAWTILNQGVADPNDSSREQAVHALGLLVKDERARRLAESSLADPSPDVRAAAATSLGQIGLGASIPQLQEAVKDLESDVGFSAPRALFVLGDQSAYQVYYAVLTGQKKSGDALLESQ